jgi:hypothetical protein
MFRRYMLSLSAGRNVCDPNDGRQRMPPIRWQNDLKPHGFSRSAVYIAVVI